MHDFQYRPFNKKKVITIPLSDDTKIDEITKWIDENVSEEEWRPGDVVFSQKAAHEARRKKGIVTLSDKAVAVRVWAPEEDDEKFENPWWWDTNENGKLERVHPTKSEWTEFFEVFPERRKPIRHHV